MRKEKSRNSEIEEHEKGRKKGRKGVIKKRKEVEKQQSREKEEKRAKNKNKKGNTTSKKNGLKIRTQCQFI